MSNLEIAAQHGIDLASPRARRQIDGELIEGFGLASGYRPARRGVGCKRLIRQAGGLASFSRTGSDLREIFLQRFNRNGGKLARDFAGQASQIVTRQKRHQQMPTANLSRAVIDRSQQPGLLNPLRQTRRQSGCACVAGFQLVQRGGQVFSDAGLIDFVAPENRCQIGIGTLNQLQQKMFRLDVVVRARKTKPRRAFERAATSRVESRN